jgi:nicotinamidase-related amidase
VAQQGADLVPLWSKNGTRIISRMRRPKLPLSSEQLELLLAFEANSGLGALSGQLYRDPSVVSRNLQRLAETLPVVSKVRGRWKITPLGLRINALTRRFLEELDQVVLPSATDDADPRPPYTAPDCVLLVINAQAALLEPALGRRSNVEAEQNISKLLARWRELRRPVIHVRHASDDTGSRFFPGSSGWQFIPLLAPSTGESIVSKKKASAFVGTQLAADLQKRNTETLIITGFTANECIDATAKQASDLGFTAYVVADATATFDLSGPDGQVHKAERVHQLVLASLHGFFATVIETSELLAGLGS